MFEIRLEGVLPHLWRIITCSSVILILAYLLRVRRERFRRLNQIQAKYRHLLNPSEKSKKMSVEDARDIIAVLVEWDCPFTYYKGLSVAMLETYTLTTVSSTLVATGRTTNKAYIGKRAEDTTMILKEIEGHGPYSQRGATALARMNWIHSLYGKAVRQEDILFIICLAIFEPIRLINWLEWRSFTELEVEARFVLWREVAGLMGVQTVPQTRAEMLEWYNDHCDSLVYTESNAILADATFELFLRPYPRLLHSGIRECLIVMLPEVMRQAFGFARAKPEWLYWVVPLVFQVRAFCIRNFCLPRTTIYDFGVRDKSLVTIEPVTQRTLYQRSHWLFEPYYVVPSFVSSLWGLIGQPIPSKKFQPEGYVIEKMGPKEFSGKGEAEVVRAAKELMERGSCPYHAQATQKH